MEPLCWGCTQDILARRAARLAERASLARANDEFMASMLTAWEELLRRAA